MQEVVVFEYHVCFSRTNVAIVDVEYSEHQKGYRNNNKQLLFNEISRKRADEGETSYSA